MKKVILSVIVLAAMIGIIEAAPFQTLGMLRTPDAYVLPHKAAEILLVGYYRDVVRPAYVDPDKNGLIPYGMIGVGILDRVELGFFGGDWVYFLNAKIKLIQETPKVPQFAVGMDNILSPVNHHRAQDYIPGDPNNPDPGWYYEDHPDKTDYEYYSPYIVGSKQAVIGGLSWMFNLGWGQNRHTGQVERSRIFNGLFASIELSPIRDLALQGEYDGKDFNAAIKLTVKNFGFKIGAQAVEDWAKGSEGNGYEDNVRVALGVSYLFDRYAEAKRSRPDLSQYAKDQDLEPIEVAGLDEPVVPPIGEDVVVDVTVPVTDVVVTDGTTVTDGTEVTIVTPGTTVTTPGVTTPTGYKELSPEVKDLLAELRNLREERQKAQKALEDLRTWLQELKQKKN